MSDPRAAIEYALLDVFAEKPLEGNMLAVFTDAGALTTETMQALARETNLAETTFIMRRDPGIEARDGVKVRIFTVQEELRFAGHPTLGTATWLHLNHPILRGSETITLDLPVGPISVRFSRGQQAHPGVFGTMQQNAPAFGATHSAVEIAHALGLELDDLDASLPIQTVSTGMAFCIVPLRSLEVARRLSIPQSNAQIYLDRSDAKFFYCITRAEPGTNADWHCRMQFYNGEDPATGSAAGCAISYLVHHGVVKAITQRSSSRDLRSIAQAESMFVPRFPQRTRAWCIPCLSAAAQFLLQMEGFSCLDAPDSHSRNHLITLH